MTDAKTELMQAVEKVMTSATFSQESVKAVAELTEKAARLESRLAQADRDLDSYKRELNTERTEVERLRAIIQARDKTITELTAKIEAGRDDKARAETSMAVAAAYKDAMEIVFRPNTVRESIQKMVPVTTSPGTYDSMGRMSGGEYVTQQPQTETVTRTEG